jgi:hypothetical protein
MEAVKVVGEAGADGVMAAGFGGGAEVEEEPGSRYQML